MLIPTSFMGRDLAPRVAVRLKAGVVTDCVELELDGDQLTIHRPVYCGKAVATFAVKLEGLRLILGAAQHIYGR